MNLFAPREIDREETRVALSPEGIGKLVGMGLDITVEKDLGTRVGWADSDYEKAGARVVGTSEEGLSRADLVVRIHKPSSPSDAGRSGTIHISYLDPFNSLDFVEKLAAAGISAISIEMIPRSTLAQKMDALSSQANLAGYAAVILAAERLDRIFPMMMTPSGTISPARVLVIGAGVAGLQAIATARRLGARVEAFDTRPIVEEQVRSLGAKFIKIDLGETGQTAQGYAKQLTPEQLARQREALAKYCSQADVVITTAQVFGRKAPVILTAEMLQGMRPGSIVIDLAAETGGNVEGSIPGAETLVGGARVLGAKNLPGHVAFHASQMLSNNFTNLITHFFDPATKALRLDPEDDILKGCLITHAGKIINPTIADLLAAKS